MELYYRIADLTVCMDTFGKNLTQAQPYLCPPVEQPDIRLHSLWEKLHEKAPEVDPEECEYIVAGGSFNVQLLRHKGLMIHSSAVILDDRAYLFTAPSGTGKSTHTQLWLRQFGGRARILNDDKPALRKLDGTWYAYGTPWSGKTDLNIPLRVPVAGICILQRGAENRIERMPGKDAVGMLMSQTLRPPTKELAWNLLELLDDLVETVPLWKLHCNMDPQAATVAFEAMSGARKEA